MMGKSMGIKGELKLKVAEHKTTYTIWKEAQPSGTEPKMGQLIGNRRGKPSETKEA